MKKLLLFLLILFISLCGCTENVNDVDTLIIYSLNDLHGSVINDNGGMSVIGSFLFSEKEKSPDNTLILAAGDMLQGTAISNMSDGKIVIELMNKIGFDAMTIGNHEFDWGVDVIASFQDGKDFDANFPMLGANIYEKITDLLVSWAMPYTIIDKGDVRVGIIGTIGDDLETSISPTIIAPYEFVDEMSILKQYTKILRVEKGVDIVIALTHSNTTSLKYEYANLTGEYQIDAIINGHTHTKYNEEVIGIDKPFPIIQSGANGSYIGKIVLTLDEDNKLKDASATNIKVTPKLADENDVIENIIDSYQENVEEVVNEVLVTAGEKITRDDARTWAANCMKKYAKTDIGIVNNGGIRSSAFPIMPGENVTVGRIWETMPFDDYVKTVEMPAKDIVDISSKGVTLSSNAYINNGKLYMDFSLVDNNEYVSVATIDYLFDNPYYNFLDGKNISNTEVLLRDYLIQDLKEMTGPWYGN